MVSGPKLLKDEQELSVSEIRWTDVLDIGLPKLDEQHKGLIALSNDLILAMDRGKGTDVLHSLFKKLKNYTIYHFFDEEEYMRLIGYPEIDEHREAHRVLTEKVNDFEARLQNNQSVAPAEALDFINGWIIWHIMEMDSLIGIYVRKSESV